MILRQNGPYQGPVRPPAALLPCPHCNEVFDSKPQCTSHQWAKHKVKSSFRNLIGDISCCPVCSTEFHERAGLIKHLSETRVRAKSRSASCRELLEEMQVPEVPADMLSKLEARNSEITHNAKLDSLHGPCVIFPDFSWLKNRCRVHLEWV